MAVTKIRKLSSWMLIILAIISIVVFAAFYLGGDNEPLMRNDEALKNPKFTDLLMYWMYILLIVAAVCLLLFGLFQFFTKFKRSPKAALGGLAIFIGVAVLLFITYAMGDATPLARINVDSQQFNVPFWLKVSDMWLYTIYVLLGISIVAMIWGGVKKALNK